MKKRYKYVLVSLIISIAITFLGCEFVSGLGPGGHSCWEDPEGSGFILFSVLLPVLAYLVGLGVDMYPKNDN